ncbi:MAG: hypothetical protein H8E15_16665 [Planctomycetes bacterium]|nr:hypothetical protein [Planctomycetota bacterium]
MSLQLAQSIIRLFGLYFIFNASVSLVRYFARATQELSLGHTNELDMGDLFWDLIPIGISIAAGFVALKRSRTFAKIVVAE